MNYVPPLNQIAFSVADLRLTERWFREGFGFLPAGGSRAFMRGPIAARVQGVPGAASTCWWLVGRNSWFQLELFQFEKPMARLMPANFRPCDIGYTRIGLWVADFNCTLARLAKLGSYPLSTPIGIPGGRRACVRSPDGVYVEIMEDDPLGKKLLMAERRECPVAVRSVTLSVKDLDATAAFLTKGIGIAETHMELHSPEHEALWGLAGAKARIRLFDAGEVLVEAVQYLDPPGKPWPEGYRISDQGILNIAFGARNKLDHMAVYNRAKSAGAVPSWRPFHIPGAGVVYVNDRQGFSVEILWVSPGKQDRNWGFEPVLPVEKRPVPDTHRVAGRVCFNASLEQVWKVVSDHEGMARWSGFSPVTVVRDGFLERNGYGAERLMHGPPGIGQVIEQVIASDSPYKLRYRVIKGSPFVCHQGEMVLKSVGKDTELTWIIRFRPRFPGSGALLQHILKSKLEVALNKQLKPYIEQSRS